MAEGDNGEGAARSGGAGDGGGGGGGGEESVKLFVGQVPKSMTEAQLLSMFKEVALVDEVNIIKDKVTKASRGFQWTLPPSNSSLLVSFCFSSHCESPSNRGPCKRGCCS